MIWLEIFGPLGYVAAWVCLTAVMGSRLDDDDFPLAVSAGLLWPAVVLFLGIGLIAWWLKSWWE